VISSQVHASFWKWIFVLYIPMLVVAMCAFDWLIDWLIIMLKETLILLTKNELVCSDTRAMYFTPSCNKTFILFSTMLHLDYSSFTQTLHLQLWKLCVQQLWKCDQQIRCCSECWNVATQSTRRISQAEWRPSRVQRIISFGWNKICFFPVSETSSNNLQQCSATKRTSCTSLW
jgi:hypothetical protein